MAMFTSLALTGAGLFLQYQGSKKQSDYQSKALNEQAQANRVRQQQMELDARRRQREMLRQQQVARAQALANSNAQSAATGSGLQGGYGQIQGQTGVNMMGVQQNAELGSAIFGHDAQASSYYAQGAKAGGMSALGQGLMGLGGAIGKNYGTINSLGTYYGNVGNQYGTIESTGSYDPWRGMR